MRRIPTNEELQIRYDCYSDDDLRTLKQQLINQQPVELGTRLYDYLDHLDWWESQINPIEWELARRARSQQGFN